MLANNPGEREDGAADCRQVVRFVRFVISAEALWLQRTIGMQKEGIIYFGVVTDRATLLLVSTREKRRRRRVIINSRPAHLSHLVAKSKRKGAKLIPVPS